MNHSILAKYTYGRQLRTKGAPNPGSSSDKDTDVELRTASSSVVIEERSSAEVTTGSAVTLLARSRDLTPVGPVSDGSRDARAQLSALEGALFRQHPRRTWRRNPSQRARGFWKGVWG
jgi:hypothetical protein